MTVTNVQITPELQAILIKAAALQNISVEELASKILGNGIQTQLSETMTYPLSEFENAINPLSGLQPYAYDAAPEESVFTDEDWDMEL
jgi:hypothetical protein